MLAVEKLFSVSWKAAWLKLRIQREKVICVLARGKISRVAAVGKRRRLWTEMVKPALAIAVARGKLHFLITLISGCFVHVTSAASK